MSTQTSILDRLLDPFMDCLTPEIAQQFVQLGIDPTAQARIDQLAAKANQGQLSSSERAEYEEFVEGIDLTGILKAKARTVLDKNAS